ncbi:MAG: AAA family ATPase [Gammaproteobacteria bacterium]|nr:AAA family ATPase [Gammaproteobacteria bacterium]
MESASGAASPGLPPEIAIRQPGVLRDAPEGAEVSASKGDGGVVELAKPLPIQATEWAVAHLAEREAVFSRSDLLAAALTWRPGAVSIGAAGKAVDGLFAVGKLHEAPALQSGEGLTTDTALADEREAIGLMRDGQNRSRPVMRSWIVGARLHRGQLTEGQREAVKLIPGAKDRVVGVQGYAGTGKTAMLKRVRALAEKNDYRMAGLAPSASAAQTLAAEAGIETETLQRFLARNAGVAEGRLTIGIGGSLAAPPLPHHRAYGSVPRRFDQSKQD